MSEKPAKKYQPRGSKTKLIDAKKTHSGPVEVLSSLIHTSEAEDNDTLIDIKVTNPLKRIYTLLQDIKKHQSTTFSLRFTIPLIALPVFLFVAFQLGRGDYLCNQKSTSKIGMVKNISVDVPLDGTKEYSFIWNFLPFLPGGKPQTTYKPEKRVLLLSEGKEPIQIIHTLDIDFTNYQGQNTVITGFYSECTNVMTVNSKNNIAIL